MDITYKPYIRDSAFKELSIKTPTININGYKPKYNVEKVEEEDIITPVESQIEEIRAPEPQLKKTTNTKKFRNRKEFQDTMIPIYEAMLIKKGLSPTFAKALVAQDGLESAWGSKPSGNFNFGGIKGKGTTKKTREVLNGKDVYINDSFRDFNSLEDYVNYKINLLNNNRYKAFAGDVSEFADRVHKGGYATDPNYSRILNNIIASAKHGGVLRFQEGGLVQGKEWVKNWYQNRKSQIKNNIQQNQRIPVPVTGSFGYNVLAHNMNLTTASVDPSKVPSDAKGVYYPNGRRIYLKEDSPSSAVHEWVHSSIPDAQVKEIDKIKDILGDSLYDQKSVIPDNYLDDPQEMYSRLMQLRYHLGVSPDHKFTNEEIDALKQKHVKQETLTNRLKGDKGDSFSNTTFDKNGKVVQVEPYQPEYKYVPEESTSHREYDEDNTFQFLNRYSTDGIRRMLNDVAQVSKKNDKALYAQFGLKVPEPWHVWKDYSNSEPIDSNWRAPMLPIEKKESKPINPKYPKDAISDSGDTYYDIVKTRTKDAYDALIRHGLTEEQANNLKTYMAIPSIKETGWILNDPNNNYFGYLADGKQGKKMKYSSKEDFWDQHLNNFDQKYGKNNELGPWWEATSLEDFIHRINNPKLNARIKNSAQWNKYQDSLRRNNLPLQWMHAPAYNNHNKDYWEQIQTIIQRYNAYNDID